jgi:ATP-dependent DNA helicase RecG
VPLVRRELPGGDVSLGCVRLVVEESQAGRLLGLDDLLILNSLWQDRRLATAAAARLIQKPERDAGSVLEHLVEAGLVAARGNSQARSYHLSAATYRQLGDQAADVRLRGFEPLQQEQMVLQYVEKYGRITRQQTAALCRISLYQSTRLLAALVSAGKLARHGTGKSTWYSRRS